MKKTTLHKSNLGFTLVELLVVISIIGMLAGLLLPAVQQARENGRRIVCVNNQSQIGLAMLSYNERSNSLPAMRGIIKNNAGDNLFGSWVAQILGQLEEGNALSAIKRGEYPDNHAIVSLQCPSGDLDKSSSYMSYVINGGTANDKGAGVDPGKKEHAVAFDHHFEMPPGASTEDADGNTVPGARGAACRTTVGIDYIGSHDGATKTILASENLQAGRWMETNEWIEDHGGDLLAHDEQDLGFSIPRDDNSYAPYSIDVENGRRVMNIVDFGKDTVYFINIERDITGNKTEQDADETAFARPSSNHPGTVVTVFADRGARPLSDTISHNVFVQLTCPADGQVLDTSEVF